MPWRGGRWVIELARKRTTSRRYHSDAVHPAVPESSRLCQLSSRSPSRSGGTARRIRSGSRGGRGGAVTRSLQAFPHAQQHVSRLARHGQGVGLGPEEAVRSSPGLGRGLTQRGRDQSLLLQAPQRDIDGIVGGLAPRASCDLIDDGDRVRLRRRAGDRRGPRAARTPRACHDPSVPPRSASRAPNQTRCRPVQ